MRSKHRVCFCLKSRFLTWQAGMCQLVFPWKIFPRTLVYKVLPKPQVSTSFMEMVQWCKGNFRAGFGSGADLRCLWPAAHYLTLL